MLNWTLIIVAVICTCPLTLFGILTFVQTRMTSKHTSETLAILTQVHAIVNSQRTEMVEHIGRLEERISALNKRNLGSDP